MPETENETGKDIQSALMDMIIADESPSAISDRIKDILYTKSAEKVDGFRPEVAANAFNSDNAPTQPEVDAALESASGTEEGGEE